MPDDDIDPEDKNLFRQSVKDAKRLDSDKIHHKREPQSITRRRKDVEDSTVLDTYLPDAMLEDVSGDEKVQSLRLECQFRTESMLL